MWRRRPLRGGTWNCKVNRHPHEVAGYAGALMREHALDFLALSEVEPEYRPELEKLPGVLVMFDGWPDAGETAILVRSGLRARAARALRLVRRWIGAKSRKLHNPRTFASARVLWLRVRAVHMPPYVHWERGQIRGAGAQAYAEAAAALVAHAGGRVRRLDVGDFNARPEDRGDFSPAWIAHNAGMRLCAPANVIDFALGRGVVIGQWEELGYGGSDHRARIFTVYPEALTA